MKKTSVPVITLDGPSGTGKGTIASLLAKALAWHVLDSGAIYRALAFAVIQKGVEPQETQLLAALLSATRVELRPQGVALPAQVFCDQQEITQAIRQESVGLMASRIAALPIVRAAVLSYQRSFRILPGLIADGRDMGTVVFPNADLKIYLTADQAVRAQRRYQQLQAKGNRVSLRDVEADLIFRDRQDTIRAIAPLEPAADAHIVDTSTCDIDQVFAQVISLVRQYVN